MAPSPTATLHIDEPSPQSSFNGISPQPQMSFACQVCVRRKIKCDKAIPACAGCQRTKLECVYVAPQPRQRKRKTNDDLNERLAIYEKILHEHGLLPKDDGASPAATVSPNQPIFLRWNEPEVSVTGKLLSRHGKSRYINSNLWRNLGDEDIGGMYFDDDDDEEEEEEEAAAEGGAEQCTVLKSLSSDPLTGAFLGPHQAVSHFHPPHADAMKLWKVHVENVEPLCKILHIPSIAKMVHRVSRQHTRASKTEECLLFAIYHFAVFSMNEDECRASFGLRRAKLMQKYRMAAKQALVNVGFLKTTDMAVMQALVLFLIPCRHFYDPNTYWILTGVAVRIAQRMGLHRDGEKLGLQPFDVQMRRRLFYQVIPLDGVASQLSGTGIAIMPDTWDTERPSNINDEQVWSGMTEKPQEQVGPTEMLFCLARCSIGIYFAKAGKVTDGKDSSQTGDSKAFESMIGEAESEVEEKYIRYCDVIDPLHYMTISFARSAINAVRLRVRLPRVKNRTATDAELKEVFKLSQRTMDINAAVHAQSTLQRYTWFMRPFFAWGSWDALVFVATILARCDLLSSTDTDGAWSKVENIYNSHDELLELKRALHAAIGRLILAAWKANPPTISMPEPNFIKALSAWRVKTLQKSIQQRDGKAISPCKEGIAVPHDDTTSLVAEESAEVVSLFDAVGFDGDSDTDFAKIDWNFWDQLIQNHHTQDTEDHEQDAIL